MGLCSLPSSWLAVCLRASTSLCRSASGAYTQAPSRTLSMRARGSTSAPQSGLVDSPGTHSKTLLPWCLTFEDKLLSWRPVHRSVSSPVITQNCLTTTQSRHALGPRGSAHPFA